MFIMQRMNSIRHMLWDRAKEKFIPILSSPNVDVKIVPPRMPHGTSECLNWPQYKVPATRRGVAGTVQAIIVSRGRLLGGSQIVAGSPCDASHRRYLGSRV